MMTPSLSEVALKKVELLAKVYDHARHRFTHGFRMLTLGWSDGVTSLPVNSCLLSTENQQNRLSEGKVLDSHCNGLKVRKLTVKKGAEVILMHFYEIKLYFANFYSSYSELFVYQILGKVQKTFFLSLVANKLK